MTSLPTTEALAVDAPLDAALRARLDSAGLAAALDDVTRTGCERVITHLADPMATDSRASYAAWLRRQVSSWSELRLPAVSIAAVDWPLASVRPQCLDVVGLLIADLRELSPRLRPTIVPAQATSRELPQPGILVAAADLCVRLAAGPARLLGGAQTLTAGTTHQGSATRFLARCADLAERAPGLAREIDRWAEGAGTVQNQLAVLTAQGFAERLADSLDSRVRRGW
jgi:hypothetical protein